jgi:zinc D-Ala-D-Ala dipeptidase
MIFVKTVLALSLIIFILPLQKLWADVIDKRPDGAFVSINELAPDIILDIRYSTDHNFVGRKIKGYNAPKCLLAKDAALALVEVQKELKDFSTSLKIYDCYRPNKSVQDFLDWAKDPNDEKMKAEFFPKIPKKDIFERGFVASKSKHSRGAAVDLTIVQLPAKAQPEYKSGQRLYACDLPYKKRFKDNSIDMGTGYDCFDSKTNTANQEISEDQKRNRLLLKLIMEKHGFQNAKGEWWHFNLVKEPYPDTYFDFDIN